jgi:UDP-glucose 4-epimerase
MGVECKLHHLDPRIEVKHAFSSHEKVAKIFGIRPATSLEEGVQRMVDWAKQVGARKSKEFENIEIEKNLPPSWAKS